MTSVLEATRTFPFLLAGELVEGSGGWEIRSPWSGETVGRAAVASEADVRRAIGAAAEAAREARTMPSHARAAVLNRVRASSLRRAVSSWLTPSECTITGTPRETFCARTVRAMSGQT